MAVVYSSDLPFDYSDAGVAAKRLVNSSRGAQTMTAGIATFSPGASVPLHTHPCEETVIIIEGTANAHIDGKTVILNKYDATIVAPNVAHFFSNQTEEPMTIAYFYPMHDAPRNDFT